MKDIYIYPAYLSFYIESEVFYENSAQPRYVRYSQGYEAYYDEEGSYHRLDGPARLCNFKSIEEWWYKGKFIPVDNQEDFEKYLKMKAFW